MRQSLLILGMLAAALPQLAASPENAAIIAATKTYVAANSGMTKLNVAVEKVEGDFARAKATPQDAGSADPAWVFLKKKDGKWDRAHARHVVHARGLSAARDPKGVANSLKV